MFKDFRCEAAQMSFGFHLLDDLGWVLGRGFVVGNGKIEVVSVNQKRKATFHGVLRCSVKVTVQRGD